MKSDQYDIIEGHAIPYYEEVQKRTFREKCIKIKNTLLMLLAYACPNNRLRIKFHKWRGVHIGKHVYIGMFCFLDNLYPSYIYIEDNAQVNAGSMILTHFDPLKQFSVLFEATVNPVLIKNGALIAVRCTIMPGVCIGKNAVVAAGSVVEKNVADYTLVKGNPAKKILEYESMLKD